MISPPVKGFINILFLTKLKAVKKRLRKCPHIPSILVFVPSHQEALESMLYGRIKDIPMSPVSIPEFVPGISQVSPHTSIHVNNDQCSLTPLVPPFERIIPYIFPFQQSIIVCLHVCLMFSCTFV